MQDLLVQTERLLENAVDISSVQKPRLSGLAVVTAEMEGENLLKLKNNALFYLCICWLLVRRYVEECCRSVPLVYLRSWTWNCNRCFRWYVASLNLSSQCRINPKRNMAEKKAADVAVVEIIWACAIGKNTNAALCSAYHTNSKIILYRSPSQYRT